MSVMVDLQIASDSTVLPSLEQLQTWCTKAVAEHRDEAEISIRIVDAEEGQALNSEWRHKDYATNVLSFPSDLPKELKLPLLGDLVICAPVVAKEAKEQHKPIQSHWAHMVVHGTLHLLGYDHIEDNEAEIMESLEIRIMDQLGFANPYEMSE